MSHITSMCKAVDFVERNLKNEITVADMAAAVSYSLYHFCRVFNKVIHHTPYDYLIRRRLSESARELIATDKKITEVAFDYRFNSPETFSRAFKRLFGTQPYQWKKRGRINTRLLMPRLTPDHIKHINKGSYLKPVLKEKDAFQVAGLMTLVRNRAIVPQLWGFLAQELQGIDSRHKSECYYGIVWYPQDWEKRGLFYLAAAEIKTPPVTNCALVIKTIPALKYARFIHKGPREDLELTLDYVYQTWLPKSGQSLACPLEIEHYTRVPGTHDHGEAEWELYIPIE